METGNAGEGSEPAPALRCVVAIPVRNEAERIGACLEALAARPEAVAPSEEERLLLIETLVEIDQLLHGLAPQVRDIFLLSQLDGLTYPQIAQRLELSVNQVQKAMGKAFAACYASRFE